jgi:hypothetical protein
MFCSFSQFKDESRTMHVTEVSYRTTRSRGVLEKRVVTLADRKFLALRIHVFTIIKYKCILIYI